jgi:hypothetical protein
VAGGYTRTEECREEECRTLWETKRATVLSMLQKTPGALRDLAPSHLGFLLGVQEGLVYDFIEKRTSLPVQQIIRTGVPS